MGNDAIEDDNWLAANRARYTQAKRHAWGRLTSRISFASTLTMPTACHYTKSINFFSHAAEHHISWTLYWITVMLGSLVSTLVNPVLERIPSG